LLSCSTGFKTAASISFRRPLRRLTAGYGDTDSFVRAWSEPDGAVVSSSGRKNYTSGPMLTANSSLDDP
jgi:hypothetical protein